MKRESTRDEAKAEGGGKAKLVAEVPASVAAEVTRVADIAQRSIAFVAERALRAAGAMRADHPVADEPTVKLTITFDPDDPARLRSQLSEAAGKLPLGQALAVAWFRTRHKFQALLERQTEAAQAERADDLDAALAAASDPTTSPEALMTLAESPYPRVRALVASHKAAPAAALTKLAGDRERYVREAVQRRGV